MRKSRYGLLHGTPQWLGVEARPAPLEISKGKYKCPGGLDTSGTVNEEVKVSRTVSARSGQTSSSALSTEMAAEELRKILVQI